MSEPGAAEPEALAPAPRWFWLLPLIAIAAWWPIDSYWQSDDFLALHYAADLDRVLRDFHGPQYGSTDIWWFYRPLITFSFWLDLQLGGAFSGWSHWSNVLAHAGNTLLVGLVWRRFVDARHAFGAAVLWTMMPGHLGSIAWAVGRVDSHTTVWCLLTLWLCLWRLDSRRPALPIAITTAAALMSKELALVVPPLATLLVAMRSHGAFRERCRTAANVTWPAWLVLALYLPFRFYVLGRFGGYTAAAYDPLSMLHGLATTTGNVLLPLRWSGTPTGSAATNTMWMAAAALPVALAVLFAVRRRGVRFAVGVACAGGLAIAPMASILAAADNPQTLRNYYLPTIALAGLLASGGRLVTLVIGTAWLWPLVATRSEQIAADRVTAAMHRAVLREADDGAVAPMFVAGMPHASPHGIAVQLHFGIDRLLGPPFREQPTRLFALRPLADQAAAFRLWPEPMPVWAIPAGSTWYFADATALGRVDQRENLPELTIVGDDHGVVDLTTPRLVQLEQLQPGESRVLLTTPSVRAPAYRMTVFTANGYLACLLFNHAPPDAIDGRIDARLLLAGDGKNIPPACYAPPSSYIGDAMPVPTTIDLMPEFPVLLEAGSVDVSSFGFTPTHRARRLLTFRFDRQYPAWVRRVQGTDR